MTEKALRLLRSTTPGLSTVINDLEKPHIATLCFAYNNGVIDLPPKFTHIKIGTIIPTKGVKLWEWFATKKNKLSLS